MRFHPRWGDDRGSIAPMIPIMAMVLLILGGLVIDASRQLNERGEAVAYAEEAARAGAQGVSLGHGGSEVALDPARARQRVADYCAQISRNSAVTSCQFEGISQSGGAASRPTVVNVRVTMRINATLLGIVGVTSLQATGTGKARPVEGLTAANS